MLSALIRSRRRYPAVHLAAQPVDQRSVQHGPLVLVSEPRKFHTPTIDRDRTVSRRSEPSSRATLNDQGALGWQSQQALASALQEGVDSGTVNAALTAWNEGDVYTVARLSCFRDEALGSNMDYTLRTSSDYRWRDSGDLHWATPSNEAVRSYLIGLMTELAQMGFDEIVLDHFGYPTQADGTLGNLGQSEDNYPAGALDGVITDFLAQAAQALEPYGTKLSLHASADVLTGTDGSAGLTMAALNASVDRVWASGTRSDVLAALEGAGVDNAVDRLVSLVDHLDPAAADAQAVWSE